MTQTLTIENVNEAFLKVIETYGREYQYVRGIADEPCYYTRGGEPACVVGHIFSRLAPEQFARLVVLEEATGMSSEAGFINDRGYMDASWEDSGEALPEFDFPDIKEGDALVAALVAAQSHQDADGTWGDAYDKFVLALASHGYTV